MPTKPKRVNKTKDELIAIQERQNKIEREKTLVKLMFPLVENMKTIYDAQTVLSALSGYIKLEVDKKAAQFVVSDFKFEDLDKEKDSEIKTAIFALKDLLAIEKANDIAGLLERFSKILAQHSANEFMKGPMKSITIDKIIA